MTMSMISQERLSALEHLEEVSRSIERLMSGPYHYPGYHNDIDMLFRKFKVAVHVLDRIEGREMPIGHLHAWQEMPPA